MLMFPLKDYQQFAIGICKFIEEHASFAKLDDVPQCIGKKKGVRQGEWKRMPISISGCTPAVVNEMPNIKFQFDVYNFDIRAKKYLDYMEISRRMIDVNETANSGICSLNIYPGAPNSGPVIGTPFLNDYYQVYDQTRNQIGLVPSIYTNPYNDDGLFTSSKIENTREKKERVVLIWLSFGSFFIAFFVRNVFMHHIRSVRDAFEEDNNTNKEKVNLWGY